MSCDRVATLSIPRVASQWRTRLALKPPRIHPAVMSQQEPALSVQITHIDHHVIHSGGLDGTTLPRAPVIRVFGKASTGVSCCLHLHQIYPYFFVEYAGEMDPMHGGLRESATLYKP